MRLTTGRHGHHAVARLLSGCWRENPGAADLGPDDAAECTEQLLLTGAAGLAWHRIQCESWAADPRLAPLRHAHRVQVLRSAVYAHHLGALLLLLQRHGVQPLLIKGPALARWYSTPELRPCGDIDLCVRAAERDVATRAITRAGAAAGAPPVDLHTALRGSPGRSAEELLSRSRVVQSAGLTLRVLCPEDELRHACLHLLRHGVWRPVWLCDVAAILEALPADFDWELCLQGPQREREYILCVVALARDLLGAQLHAAAPAPPVTPSTPRWVTAAVLRQWGSPGAGATRASWRARAKAGQPVISLLAARCNPVESTARLRAPLGGMPRLPIQVADALISFWRMAAHRRPGVA